MKVLILDADGHFLQLLSSFVAEGRLVVCHYKQFRRNLDEPAAGEEPNEAIMRIVGSSRGSMHARDGMANFRTQVLYQLYDEHGVFDGSTNYPTIFDEQRKLKRMKFRVESRTAGYWESVVNRVDTWVMEMGPTFDCVRGFSAEQILDTNLLLDLRGLSAFNLQFFVTDLVAYLIAYKSRHPSEELTNVIFIDELHRYIPKNLQRDDLAEPLILTIARTMRKWGVGLVLADQVPGGIPSAVMGNMGSRLILKLLNGSCIRTVGASCSLTAEQMAFIPELQPGQGVLHYNRFPKPFLVELPELRFERGVQGDGAGRMNPLELFTWTPRSKEEQPKAEKKEEVPKDVHEEGPILSKEALDYLVAIAQDEFVPSVARDKRLGVKQYRGTALRAELELAGLIEIERFNVGRRGGQIAITGVTQRGWELLAQMKVPVKKGPGRGSLKHRYYQHVVKAWCEKRYPGARVEVEEAVEGDHWVDVAVYVDTRPPQKKNRIRNIGGGRDEGG